LPDSSNMGLATMLDPIALSLKAMQTHSPEPDNHARLRSLNQLKYNGKKKDL
jgi:hypothetical protein